jgi:hypothetical protein
MYGTAFATAEEIMFGLTALELARGGKLRAGEGYH